MDNTLEMSPVKSFEKKRQHGWIAATIRARHRSSELLTR